MKLFNLLLSFIFTLVLCCTPPSIAQSAQEDIAMERFDIETFNHNKDGYSWIYTSPDGTKIWQREDFGNGYQVEITPPHSNYTTIKLFNYEGNLIHVWLQFHSFIVGVSKEYDGRGNVIKEYDQDKGFAFSIDDLIQKMQDEYGVDITDTRQTFTVYRGGGEGEEAPFYGLYVYDFSQGKNTTRTIAYLFDGNTGKLLYTIPADIEGSPSIMMEYRKMLEQNKLSQ